MGDWKDTLFVWRGSLKLLEEVDAGHEAASGTAIGAAINFTWEGTWLPLSPGETVEEMLSADAFAQSSNTFSMVGVCTSDTEGIPVVNWHGKYSLDNGNGPEQFEDILHCMRYWRTAVLSSTDEGGESKLECACKMKDDRKQEEQKQEEQKQEKKKGQQGMDLCRAHFMASWGQTEFGPFTSRGFMTTDEHKKQHIMVLARRYLGTKDARLGKITPHDINSLTTLTQSQMGCDDPATKREGGWCCPQRAIYLDGKEQQKGEDIGVCSCIIGQRLLEDFPVVVKKRRGSKRPAALGIVDTSVTKK